MANKATIDKYETKATVNEYKTKAVIDAYITKVTNIQNVAKEIDTGEQPISSIKTTAEFYNEIRLETGYSDTQNVNPLTNFSDSGKPNESQGTPSKRGEFKANEINTHPAILSDGVDDFYDLGNGYEDVLTQNVISGSFVINTLGSGRLFGSQDKDSGSNNAFQLEVVGPSDNRSLRIIYGANGDLFVYAFDGGTFADGTYLLYSFFMDFDNNIIQHRVNGSEVPGKYQVFANTIADVNPANYVNPVNLALFARMKPSGPDNFTNVKIAEHHIGNDPLADLKTQESDLNSKYTIY